MTARASDDDLARAHELSVRLSLDGLDDTSLVCALTHRSYCAENPGVESNERLEFLGDAVLGVIVTEHLFTSRPHLSEGDLARIRAVAVSEQTLARLARSLGIGHGLRLGRGEQASGGKDKASLLADALEALIGAVFLAGGFERAKSLILELFVAEIDAVADSSVLGDAKNQLQELATRDGLPHPVYSVVGEGPEHSRRFVARVSVGEVETSGEGHSKKSAERAAAVRAISELRGQDR